MMKLVKLKSKEDLLTEGWVYEAGLPSLKKKYEVTILPAMMVYLEKSHEVDFDNDPEDTSIKIAGWKFSNSVVDERATIILNLRHEIANA